MISARSARVWALIAEQATARGASVTACDVCRACVSAVGVDGAGITLMGGSSAPQIVWASDQVSEQLEELQVTLGEGPCRDASAARGPVLTPDMADERNLRRWPAFGPAAIEAGAHAMFAFPLQVGGIRVGALDLYRDRVGSLSGDELADALVFPDAATLMLLDDQARSPEMLVEHGLDTFSAARTEVHQATGMVAAQLGTGVDEAFTRLRAHAYAQETRLADVARDVVARRLHFDPETTGPDAV